MPVKIRLQRHGKKGKPFYWIVAADARSKRDGKFLEKLGIYNPNTNPATIELDVEGSVKWLGNGAQPTETAKRLLSYKGALLKHHLQGGVAKGALTQEEADKKFEAWVAEKAVNEAREKAAAEAEAAAQAEETASEEVVEEAASEEVVEEATSEEAATEEAATEEATEEKAE